MLNHINKYVIIVFFGFIMLIAMYTFLQLNKNSLNELSVKQENMSEVVLDNQKLLNTLRKDLAETGSNSYIEKSARAAGYIMPNEKCFEFSNPNSLIYDDEAISDYIENNK